jgi:hypothetical protein
METERIALSQRERDRLRVLHGVQQQQITGDRGRQAAEDQRSPYPSATVSSGGTRRPSDHEKPKSASSCYSRIALFLNAVRKTTIQPASIYEYETQTNFWVANVHQVIVVADQYDVNIAVV